MSSRERPSFGGARDFVDWIPSVAEVNDSVIAEKFSRRAVSVAILSWKYNGIANLEPVDFEIYVNSKATFYAKSRLYFPPGVPL